MLILGLTACNEKNHPNENTEIITWNSPQEITTQGFFPKKGSVQEPGLEAAGDDWDGIFYEDFTKYYKVGEIKTGTYQGGEILLVISPPQFLSYSDTFRFIKKDNKFILLNTLSDEIKPKSFSEKQLKNITLQSPQELNRLLESQLNAPDTMDLDGENNGKILKKEALEFNVFFSPKNLVPVEITNPALKQWQNHLYMKKNEHVQWDIGPEGVPDPGASESGGLFLQLPDGTLAIYGLVIPFENPQSTDRDFIPKITFTNNQVNQEDYGYFNGTSCGFGEGSVAKVPNGLFRYDSFNPDAKENEPVSKIEEVPFTDNDLMIIGHVTGTKDPIYGFKNNNHPVLKTYYDKYYKTQFKNVNDGIILPYKDYIKHIPFFFWTDSFGRKIMFTNFKFLMVGACAGKPVIYLYPTQEQAVSVKVNTSHRAFISWPEYGPANGTGWQVTATPEGKITETSSGKNYPYLFWEDLINYATPNKGFIVAKQDIPKFLDTKLGFIGLNQQEINDFKEFWVPKMQQSPWYKISFLQTEAMNRTAPLQIQPKPDTLIRVFMDYKELKSPENIKEQNLQPATRSGFTAVEWGGKL